MSDETGSTDQASQRVAIMTALRLRDEIRLFQANWPEGPEPERPMPPFTWEQLTRQLADLTSTPEKASMARTLVSATRKQAGFKPAEMVLREVLCLTWALMDDDFRPGSGEGAMT